MRFISDRRFPVHFPKFDPPTDRYSCLKAIVQAVRLKILHVASEAIRYGHENGYIRKDQRVMVEIDGEKTLFPGLWATSTLWLFADGTTKEEPIELMGSHEVVRIDKQTSGTITCDECQEWQDVPYLHRMRFPRRGSYKMDNSVPFAEIVVPEE